MDTSCCSCRGAQLSALLVFGFGSVRGVLANRAAPPRDQCNSADTAGTIASARSAATRPARSAPCAESWMEVRGSAPLRRSLARAARATGGTTRRDAVPLFAHGGSGEASPVSAGRAQCNAAGSIGSIGRAVARRTPGRLEAVDSNASKRSIQTPRSGQCKRQRGRRGTRGAWSGPSAPDGRSDGKPRARSSRRPRASGTTRRAAAM